MERSKLIRRIILLIGITGLVGLIMFMTGCVSRVEMKNYVDMAFQLGYYRGRSDCYEQANANFYKQPVTSSNTVPASK